MSRWRLGRIEAWGRIGILAGLVGLCVFAIVHIREMGELRVAEEFWKSEEFRKFDVGEAEVEKLFAQADREGGEGACYVGISLILRNWSLQKKDLELLGKEDLGRWCTRYGSMGEVSRLCTWVEGLYPDRWGRCYFPVPVNEGDGSWVSYENSWGNQRTYGEIRVHEGTDLMPEPHRKSGSIPILSVCDGRVEQLGWLEKGGWRVGIRNHKGVYYYYAHLASYEPTLKKGQFVHSGQLLGFMGNSGYSKVPGTTGKFPVHLHFGLYVEVDGQEISINPYHILRYLERYRLQYTY